eukprot:gene810-1582_t
MFTKKHGRKHVLTGIFYIFLLLVGFSIYLRLKLNNDDEFSRLLICGTFQVILGVCGILLTLFAAYEFPHKNIRNFASGTLDETATVTHDEMIEHKFFLQTLVKRKYMRQNAMIALQQILMLASTLAAIPILIEVNFLVAILSCALNFTNRGQDFLNTILVTICYSTLSYYLPGTF